MRRLAASLILLLAVLAACRRGADAGRPTGPLAPGEADDAARFLAGLPGRGTSAFKILESDPAWREHSRHLNAMSTGFLERRAPQMR